MTTIAQEYLAAHEGDRAAAMLAFAEGLMKGDKATHKAGYTRDNAVLAAVEIFRGTDEERDALLAGLPEGFVEFGVAPVKLEAVRAYAAGNEQARIDSKVVELLEALGLHVGQEVVEGLRGQIEGSLMLAHIAGRLEAFTAMDNALDALETERDPSYRQESKRLHDETLAAAQRERKRLHSDATNDLMGLWR
jgi:hypothetical protein